MKILRLIASPRGRASESYGLSQQILGFLRERDSAATLIERDLRTLPHPDASYATALGATRQSPAELYPEGSMALSDELVDELDAADAVIIATPMHNFTVPSTLKAWIDHIVRVRRTFHTTRDGKLPVLHDRPIFVAISSGAKFSGERARQPDFLTPYLTAILATIGLHDLRFFAIEGTGPDALAAARLRADAALHEHFASFALDL